METRASTIVTDGLVLYLDVANKRSIENPAVNCAIPPLGQYGSGGMSITEVLDGSIKPHREGARVFKYEITNVNNYHRQGGYYSYGGFGGGNSNPLLLGTMAPDFTTVGTGKYIYGMHVRGSSINTVGSYMYIDIGDRNGGSVSIGNNTTWQFVSVTDAGGINSTVMPYDFFDFIFAASVSIGDIFYISDYFIYRSIGTVNNLAPLSYLPSWIDYGQTRGDVIYDLSGNGNTHSVIDAPIYSKNPTKLRLNGVSQGFYRDASITTSPNCTVVIYYSTFDTTELWVEGIDGGWYLSASDVGGTYYHGHCGSPLNYVDLIQRTAPLSYRDGNFHMWEAKNIDFSDWTKFQWFLYYGGWQMDGYVASIMVYDRVLSAQESMKNYKALKYRFQQILPVQNNCVMWVDANDISSIGFSSTTYVKAWADKSRNGSTLLQSTSSAYQPMYVENILNGKGVVRFDGAQNILIGTLPTGIVNCTMFIVMKIHTAYGENLYFSIGTATQAYSIRSFYSYDGYGSDLLFAGWGDDVLSTPTITLDLAGAYHVFAIKQDGTSITFYRDSDVGLSTVPIPLCVTSTAIALGGINGNDGYYNANVDVAEAIAYNKTLSDGEITVTIAYLRKKWGI